MKATLRPGANFGAPGLWSRVARRGRRALRNCTAIHLLAPYGVADVPLTLIWQAGGSRKASLTLTRAARPEGRGGDSQEGRNHWCLPSCAPAARSGTFCLLGTGTHLCPIRQTACRALRDPAEKRLFYQLSDPSSGMTAFMPVIATSIMESSGSNTVRCWIIRPGQRSAREMTLSERPA